MTLRKRSEVGSGVSSGLGSGTRVPVSDAPVAGGEVMHGSPERPSLAHSTVIEHHHHEAPTLGEQAERTVTAPDGDELVEVTWGEEIFQPVQFNTYRVGPFKATVRVRQGESVAAAIVRVHHEISVAAAQIRDEKTRNYIKAMEYVADETTRAQEVRRYR